MEDSLNGNDSWKNKNMERGYHENYEEQKSKNLISLKPQTGNNSFNFDPLSQASNPTSKPRDQSQAQMKRMD